LAEFAERPWAQLAAARLEELRLTAVEALAEWRLAAGEHARLVGELEGLVAVQPMRERLRGLLMVGLYRSGRQADALAVYQQAREVLAEELGIDPSPELQRLQQAILVQDPALEGSTPPKEPHHNLPERLTSFVGRDAELGELAKLVEQHRLVTVVGAGGAGKTSLAVELARRLAGGYADGVWLVELAALGDPDLLGEAVAAAVGLGAEPAEPGIRPLPPAERLAGFVADKGLLVVLDNCEHLVGACAGLVRRLLEAGPGLGVLATSREVLGVPGEVIWPVPPLAVPTPTHVAPAHAPTGLAGSAAVDLTPEVLVGYDAVRLFVDRASTADPGFVLDGANAAVVAELCRRLDGLPLAIELAAARVRALPPPELALRLQDRFRLLAGGGRAADPRQQTLRATIDWSWELLADPDRRLLGRLSVFSGGWTVPAAEVVCGGDGLDPGGVLEGLFRLVDRSLVVAVGGEPARFRLLESLGAYGAERLAEAGETREVAARHTAWCLRLAEEAAAHRTARPWLGRVAADYDNLRAALDRAVAAPDPETALRLAGALGWYWWTDRTIEGRQLLAGALALADGQPPTPPLARALQASAMLEVSLTPSAATAEAARRSQELFERFGDRHAAAMSKVVLGQAERQRVGPSEEGARRFEEAEATFRELGDRWGQAYAQSAWFAAESYFGEPARAFALAEQALEGFGAVGDQRGRAWLLFVLGMAARFRGQLEEATGRYQEALAAARQAGPTWVTCSALIELGSLAALAGEDARADELHAEAAALALATPQPPTAVLVLVGLAWVAAGRGDPERAARLLGAAAATRNLVGVPATGAERQEADLAGRAAAADLTPEAFQAATAAGRTLAPDEALRVALG
jgi:predicted ATPase/tetratricopeptide (TPR) repeat protein